jgi:hypothetical protein
MSSETRPSRERKKTNKFIPESKSATTEISIPEGAGEKLGDSEHFVHFLGKLKSDHDLLKGLHQICYGRAGKETTRKRTLRAFCGFGWSEDEEEKKSAAAVSKWNSNSKWTINVVKELAQLLGVPHTGKKEGIWNEIVNYLVAPSSVSRKGTSRKRKGGSTSKPKKDVAVKKAKKVKDPNAPKRALSSFILFSNAKRTELKANNPEWKVTEVSAELGRLWREATDDEKAPFVEAAEADKERYAEEMAAYTQ